MFFELVLTELDWSARLREANGFSSMTLDKLNGAIPVLLGRKTGSPRVTPREFDEVEADLKRTSLFCRGFLLEPQNEDGRLVLREKDPTEEESPRRSFDGQYRGVFRPPAMRMKGHRRERGA